MVGGGSANDTRGLWISMTALPVFLFCFETLVVLQDVSGYEG